MRQARDRVRTPATNPISVQPAFSKARTELLLLCQTARVQAAKSPLAHHVAGTLNDPRRQAATSIPLVGVNLLQLRLSRPYRDKAVGSMVRIAPEENRSAREIVADVYACCDAFGAEIMLQASDEWWRTVKGVFRQFNDSFVWAGATVCVEAGLW